MPTNKSSTPYLNFLVGAQKQISAEISQIRKSLSHTGEIGDLVERVFRKQISQILPEKVRVSHGFVVDSHGKVSKQMDIILYDRLNTPRIFTSPGAQMFPVESTFACGEIKTQMNVKEFKDSFEKCLSYKDLKRCAYYPDISPISKTYSLFGEEACHWRSIFFCIAEESVCTSKLAEAYNEIVKERNLEWHLRIDTFVAMQVTEEKKNTLLNCGGVYEDGIPWDRSIDLLPSSKSRISSYPAREPWSLFTMLLLRYMTFASTGPVNMLKYGGNASY